MPPKVLLIYVSKRSEKSGKIIPRSRLATIAHMMLNKANGDPKFASKLITEDIRDRGGSAKEEYINISGDGHFATIIPASQTNYDTKYESVAIVPKMDVNENHPHEGHVGIITPDKG